MTYEGDRCVYFHMTPGEGSFYIGMGTTKRAFNRSNRSDVWKQKVESLGGRYNVFFFESGLGIDEAAEIEKTCIQFFGVDNLTNKSRGGEHPAYGMRHSEQTKQILSRKSKAFNNKPTVKEKLKQRMSGDGNPMRGVKHSDETRERMRRNHKTAKEVYGFTFHGSKTMRFSRSAFRVITGASLEDAQNVILRRYDFKGWRRVDE